MGSNCQLSSGDSRPSRRERNAVRSRVSEPTILSGLCSTLTLLALLSACGDPDGGGDDDAGTTGGADSTGEQGTAATVTDPSAGTSGGADATGSSDGGQVETGEPGPNFGLLTFTFYPADATGAPDQLGMAGAWRVEPFTTDDFHAVRALGLLFPPAPAGVDALEVHEPSQYDWGKGDAWVTLGNGVRLAHADGDAVACLELVDDTYPVYLSDDAAFLDPACAPAPDRWHPASRYDLVVYGGVDFDDQIVVGAVATPAALTVTAPDPAAFDFPLERATDLDIAWDANGSDGDRVVIRVWDQFGRQIAVHAADDGAFTVPAAELGKLAPGPVDLTVARERVVDLGLAAGTLRVAARYEVALYPDLF